MRRGITTGAGMTTGLDLGDRWRGACGVDAAGQTVVRQRMRTTRAGLDELAVYRGARVVMEVGTHSPWVSRRPVELGFGVIVANLRRVRLIAQSD